jgi:PAS domain S-box-containing protein
VKTLKITGSSFVPGAATPGDELARLFLDATAEGIYCTDPSGCCTFANRACVELLGFETDREMIGRPAHGLLHHSHADGSPQPLETCGIHLALRESRGYHSADEVMWRKDGSSFEVEYWSYPVERRGELVGCVVTFLDLSAEKRLERQLRESADHLGRALVSVGQEAAALAELAAFAEMHPGPVLQLDLQAEVMAANAAAREIFGGEVIGRNWSEICPVSSPEKWRQVLSCSDPVTLDLPYGGGEYSVTYRHNPQTQVVFVFGVDVTAQRRAERALRQSEKMATLGTLAAGVAHELNNPASAVQRGAEQLREAVRELERAHRGLSRAGLGEPHRERLRALEERAREQARTPYASDALARADAEEAVEEWLDSRGIDDASRLAPALATMRLDAPALDELARALGGEGLAAALDWVAAAFPAYSLLYEIRQGAARISEIVGALKSYSYLGQAPMQAVDIHEGLDNTLVILRSRLKEGVAIRREYGSDLPRIGAYGSELNQVWTNLIDNAIDAMNGAGSLVIRTRREDDQVIVEIEDDGPGISPAIQDQVFDPFFTTKEPGKGTGLGLATSYGIVTEKHHGNLSVVSQPGSTRFIVRLPIEALEVPAPLSEKASDRSADPAPEPSMGAAAD